MRFTTVLAGAASIAVATANLSNPFSPIPGYPLGNGVCLTDAQASFIAATFKSILTNPDRKGAATTSNTLIADNYVETSDSINILAGYPLGGPSFNGKTAFIQGVAGAPAITKMTTFEVVHDCNHITWRWQVDGLALAKYPVKGINEFVVSNVLTGQITADYIEFSSLAWGVDIGWTCTPPPPQAAPAS